MLMPTFFTLQEANGLVPHIVSGTATAKVAIVRAHALRAELLQKLKGKGEAGVALVQEEHPDLMAEIAAADDEAKSELGLLQDLGVVLSSLEPAEANVLAKRGLETVVLCWQGGERSFTHWHGISETREQMRPIKDPSSFGADLLPS